MYIQHFRKLKETPNIIHANTEDPTIPITKTAYTK